MKKTKNATSSDSGKKMRPPMTPEARENQLTSLAMDLAEKQLREGTASSQVIAHFLKNASTRNQIELEKLNRENELLRAKTDSLQSAQRIEELYKQAMDSMRKYSGYGDEEGDVDDY